MAQAAPAAAFTVTLSLQSGSSGALSTLQLQLPGGSVEPMRFTYTAASSSAAAAPAAVLFSLSGTGAVELNTLFNLQSDFQSSISLRIVHLRADWTNLSAYLTIPTTPA